MSLDFYSVQDLLSTLLTKKCCAHFKSNVYGRKSRQIWILCKNRYR